MQNFLLKGMLKSQIKDLPPEQQEKVLKAFEENPDFFKKMADDIKAKVDSGVDKQTAAMSVMMEHREELAKMLGR